VENLNTNLRTIGTGTFITLILAIIGDFYGFIWLIAPLIGGLIAGYQLGGSLYNGIMNGGFAAGVGAVIATLITELFFSGAAVAVGNSGVLLGAIFLSMVLNFVIFFVLGAIGGIFGVLMKENP
jgi:hypothetical protein